MRRHFVVHRKDGVNSIQINGYADPVNGDVTSSDMSIHLTKIEDNKDKITTETNEDVKFPVNFSNNSDPLLNSDRVSVPLDLNLRTQDGDNNNESTNFDQFNGRQDLLDREANNTLFVWIPTSAEQLLQSE